MKESNKNKNFSKNNHIFNVVIIGLGNIGLKYDISPVSKNKNYIQTHAKAFDSHPNFKLLAGVDINKKNCEIFENIYKVKGYEDLQKCLSENNPDICVIATPTKSHKKISEIICESNLKIKFVLCEKPIAYSLEEAYEIEGLFKSRSIPFFVNYMRLSDPGVIEIKNKIDINEIKLPLKGFCWYTKGIYNNASHFINLLEFWLGQAESVTGIIFNRNLDSQESEYDFKIYFQKGSISFKSLWEEKFSHNSIELLFSNGKLSYLNGGMDISMQKIKNDDYFDGYKVLSKKLIQFEDRMFISQFNVVSQIFNYLTSKRYFLCSSNEAIGSLKIIEKIKTHKSVNHFLN